MKKNSHTVLTSFPCVLSISHSDPMAGSGIQADIKTISSLDCYASTIITSICSQNTMGIKSSFALHDALVEDQIESVFEDSHFQFCKIGFIENPNIIIRVHDALCFYKTPYLFDCVLPTIGGNKISNENCIINFKKYLFPYAELICLNIEQAQIISKQKIKNKEDFPKIATLLHQEGIDSLIIKGGDLDQDRIDNYVSLNQGQITKTISHPRFEIHELYGAGNCLSAAIACFRASKIPLEKAIDDSFSYIQNAIKDSIGVQIGMGGSPISTLLNPKNPCFRQKNYTCIKRECYSFDD